jgi:hypothetical protein
VSVLKWARQYCARMAKIAVVCVAGVLSAQSGARSVHLKYSAPPSTVFYNEVTVEKSAPGSYFMACGFRQGYFGIQDLGPGRRKVVIFSVWDTAAANGQTRVPASKRVQVIYKGENVVVRRFGGEGTGEQSFFDYDWRIGGVYKFRVAATVEGDQTSFAAWFFINETGAWKHLVTFRAIAGGSALRDLYSFIEDFRRDTKSLREPRAARFGNGWARGTNGAWAPLAEARFTVDPTPAGNIDAGVREGDFYLATGGDTANHTAIDSTIRRPQSRQLPPEWQ